MSDKYSIGSKFGTLTIADIQIKRSASGRRAHYAICRCDCGNEHVCEKYNLSTGNTVMCASCSSDKKSRQKRTHGHGYKTQGSTDIERKCYYTWAAMKARCSNPNNKRYSDYGGRGISVCERWGDYENFLQDMSLPPSIAHQIDRIDNDLDYSPDNCRWVTRIENSRNKRNSRWIEAFGQKKTLAEWSEITGIKRECISQRMRRGWTADQALGLEARK